MHSLRTIVFLGLFSVLGGCSSSATLENPQPVSAEAYRATFDASIDVLRDHGFVVGRQDYRFGRVTSQPRPSPVANG
jgi:hypothetical protein